MGEILLTEGRGRLIKRSNLLIDYSQHFFLFIESLKMQFPEIFS